jgi:hypothetical protein
VQSRPPRKVSAGSIRRFPPVSAGRLGANRRTEAFADALDIVDESEAPENGNGFPPFPVFPPVRAAAGETCERWNMLRSSWRDGRKGNRIDQKTVIPTGASHSEA